MKRIIFAVNFIAITITLHAAQIDSVMITSRSMDTKIKTAVIVPEIALGDSAKRCPVIYLLHGYGGSEKQWLYIKPDLLQIADEKNIIFVIPDGKNSWYLNSPLDKNSQYETFISSELIEFTDSSYKTLPDRNHRAITGLSMGGHGALFNAFRHKEIFGAAGSMSGAVDIRQRGNNSGLVKLLGSFDQYPENWDNNSVLNHTASINSGDLAIYIDCGKDDFCFKQNETLHAELNRLGINHDYTIRPGAHTHDYWRNSIDYHILFFSKYFQAA
ncbi:MAG: esterase family protein [Dysgonamonadaceae bacterium]|nr:esterase family protein [Dysgonamonadaceae bacterium]